MARASCASSWIPCRRLDDSEPNVPIDGLHYRCGPAEYCGALWAQRWVEIFANGARESGSSSPVMLSRAGWAGFQTTGAVMWSSDIPSTFESLQIQVRAGKSAVYHPLFGLLTNASVLRRPIKCNEWNLLVDN